jgi:hypothetical protein
MITNKTNEKAMAFYQEVLELLNESGIPFLLGGAFATYHHTGVYRDTKDLDIFCKASVYPEIMKFFTQKGYRTELHDVRWLAKLFKEEFFVDVIFANVNNMWRVEDAWFDEAEDGIFAGIPVKMLPAEELIREKIYIQNRERYDGADINHLMLKCGHTLDWKKLLSMLDIHWHLLLSQLINFQFVYPADYQNVIPKWLFEELMARASDQYVVPAPLQRVCRGPMIDQTQYCIDVKEWGYKSYTIMTV